MLPLLLVVSKVVYIKWWPRINKISEEFFVFNDKVLLDISLFFLFLFLFFANSHLFPFTIGNTKINFPITTSGAEMLCSLTTLSYSPHFCNLRNHNLAKRLTNLNILKQGSFLLYWNLYPEVVEKIKNQRKLVTEHYNLKYWKVIRRQMS